MKTSTTRTIRSSAAAAGEPWMWQLTTADGKPRMALHDRGRSQGARPSHDRTLCHASLCNGALKCTYNDLYGVRRASIRESINRLCALGLIKRTRVGRRGYGEAKGEAAEYELTFYATRTENNNVLFDHLVGALLELRRHL